MEASPQSHFYVVSMRKFTLLFIGTVGLYAFYWFYRMFKTMGQTTNRDVFPILRALLPFLFILGLNNFIYREEQKRENPRNWSPDFLAWVFVGSWATQMLLVLASDNIQPMFYMLIQMVAFLAQFYSIYQVQLAVNRIEKDPFGRANTQLNTTNILWLLFGIFFWANTLLNTYLLQTGRLPHKMQEQPVEEVMPAPIQ